MTEIYLHMFARMADYIHTHPYPQTPTAAVAGADETSNRSGDAAQQTQDKRQETDKSLTDPGKHTCGTALGFAPLTVVVPSSERPAHLSAPMLRAWLSSNMPKPMPMELISLPKLSPQVR